MDLSDPNVKQLLDLVKQYGDASHEAAKKGDQDKAEALWKKSQEALVTVYKLLGLA